MNAGRERPRFVPTLTEVVHPDAADAAPVPTSPPFPKVPAPLQPALAPSPSALPVLPGGWPVEALEEQIVHRVMQRIDVGLNYRLREVLSSVIEEQTRIVAVRLHEDIEAAVRRTVAEAIAEELAVRPGP